MKPAPLTKEQCSLVENNLKLVTFTVKRFATQHQDRVFTFQDLFQIGCIGLCKAARVYNPASGYTFSTFAYRVIQNELFQFFRSQRAKARKTSFVLLSLDEPIRFHKGGQALASDVVPDPDMDVERIVTIRRMKQALRQVSSGSLHDRVIIQTLLGNLTQSQAAKLIGISQPQVCRELKKMRTHLQSQIKLPTLEE